MSGAARATWRCGVGRNGGRACSIGSGLFQAVVPYEFGMCRGPAIQQETIQVGLSLTGHVPQDVSQIGPRFQSVPLRSCRHAQHDSRFAELSAHPLTRHSICSIFCTWR